MPSAARWRPEHLTDAPVCWAQHPTDPDRECGAPGATDLGLCRACAERLTGLSASGA
ncbi:MAG: hypothetical protein KY434_06875 [Actinobacteria bacterium]|nr:hypothetical protein [Actinomycetota bacterium]